MSYHHGDLRNALLQRAEAVIAAQGLDAVKLSLLAKDLGVSHGAPARHFQDRKALLSALAHRALETLEHSVAAAPGMQHSDPRIRLNTLLKCQLQNTLNNPAHFILLGHPDLPRIVGPDYEQALGRYNAFFAACTGAAQQAGWRAGEDPVTVALLTYSVAIGLQTIVRYALETEAARSAENTVMKASAELANALTAIDLFIPCPP